MDMITATLLNPVDATKVAAAMISKSVWFEMTPFSFDEYIITTKNETVPWAIISAYTKDIKETQAVSIRSI